MNTQAKTLEGVEIEIREKAPGHRAHLPTFPWEEGWREFYDEELGKIIRTPLTLSDIVSPVEAEDIGTLHMIHNPDHNHWRDQIGKLMASYLGKSWIILNEVFVRWPYPGVPSTAADMTAILVDEEQNEYDEYKGQNPFVVWRDGLLPSFIIEITSALTRTEDVKRKPIIYAAKGVEEYLVIDIMTPEDEDWQLSWNQKKMAGLYLKL